MQDYHSEIIQRYKKIASLPDYLFAFTFPLRKRAVRMLELQPGQSVLEVGCSSGANFNFLRNAVGPNGSVVGVDLSPEMVVQARLRIQKNRWENIQVIESAAESVVLDQKFDGLLLFAIHDVLTSSLALKNIFSYIKPGGHIVVAGPQLADKYPGKLLNPFINLVYSKFSVSQEHKDRPWILLADMVDGLEIEHFGPGIMYLVKGVL